MHHYNLIEPVNMIKGLNVTKNMENIPFKWLGNNHADRVLAKVQAGELVIPKKYVLPVEKYLKSKNIHLSGMK